jgi:ubiquinone/menaquinone biosynthesis C-methylase UbiE
MALPSPQQEAHLICPLSNNNTQYLATIRAHQAQARYPALLQLWNQEEGVLYRKEHSNVGLITIAVEQEALDEQALRALGEFRLHQYLLCGWYDAARVLADQATMDPQLARIPPSSVHLLTGTPEGQFLAYCTLQAAAQEERDESLTPTREQYLHEFPRALFPAERELFGPVLFATLPALRTIPLSAIGDLTCLLQNQALHSPLRTIALVEAILSIIHLLTRPSSRWSAVLGNMDQEARSLLASLGVPVLYAPQAQVMVDSLPYKHYWAAEEIGSLAQGKYWPFVIAVDDLRAQQHFEQAHQAFAGDPHNIRRSLVAWRRQQTPVAPVAFVPPIGTRAAQIWGAPLPENTQRKREKNMLGKRREELALDKSTALVGAIPPSAPAAAEHSKHPPVTTGATIAGALGQFVAEGELAAQRYKTLSYDMLQLARGMQVLDIGCGNGTDLSALAERVGEEGFVVGLDHDPQVVQAAEEAHRGREHVRVVLSRAEHLPFAHRSFDAVRTDRVLQFVPEPAKVLAEMWRVLRPGGIVTLIETDWQAVAVYPSSQAGENDDHTLHAILQRTCVHPLIGRSLHRLLHQSGKWDQIEVRVEFFVFTSWAEADTILLLSKVAQTLAEAEPKQAEDIHAWMQKVDAAAQQGDFFASMPLFFASARKVG